MTGIEGIIAINRIQKENAASERTELPNGKFLYRGTGEADIIVASQPFCPPPYEQDLNVLRLREGKQWLVNNRLVNENSAVVETLVEHGVPNAEALVAELASA